jgi:hydroxymethylglutaryl-CoA reductase (NADPH)
MIGYVPVPLGVAGPLLVDGVERWLPMATTEGALIASTSRGCKVVREAGGVRTVVLAHQMTRGPVLKASSIEEGASVKRWVESREAFSTLAEAFKSTSQHIRLASLKVSLAGRLVFIRFAADTAEAMGMNMVSKATEYALHSVVLPRFPALRLLGLSGNFCTDKKVAGLNWTEGRGWSVVAEAKIPREKCTAILGVEAGALVELCIAKNFVGSTMAGAAAGGQNAHAANVVAAVFLATGQDMAQVVQSSGCLTLMGIEDDMLVVTCTMPCIEVGTIGGGTRLAAQRGSLELALEEHVSSEGLARLICAAVLAGEISLLAALSSGSLVTSHLALNRK